VVIANDNNGQDVSDFLLMMNTIYIHVSSSIEPFTQFGDMNAKLIFPKICVQSTGHTSRSTTSQYQIHSK